MSVKIFLPTNYFYFKHTCTLYGQVQISDDNIVVYYIVDNYESGCTDIETTCELRPLGSIVFSEPSFSYSYKQKDMPICFTCSNESPNISLVHIGITPESIKQIKIFLYDKCTMQSLFITKSCQPLKLGINLIAENNDYFSLFRLNYPRAIHRKETIMNRSLNLFANIPTQIFSRIVESSPINKIMMHTIIYKHYKEWEGAHIRGSRLTNIVLDRALGLIVLLALFMFFSHPGEFLIQISHSIINRLYSLSKVLEGSPIGLKLNIHLNNFFLDCFKYHIELWSIFLDLIEPVIRQLFFAIGLLGCLGVTYQIALLADLISIVGLHAQCFYVYTKVLYKVEVKGLTVLWQVVRGKRHNILRNRIETHNYMNRQLYLATIFFSAILFLFPTIFVYYIVFATLKSLTFITHAILDFMRRQILHFPIEAYIKWLTRNYFEIEGLKVRDVRDLQHQFLNSTNFCLIVFVFKIEA